LAAYYKADTKYCWRHITKPIPSIVGGILQGRGTRTQIYSLVLFFSLFGRAFFSILRYISLLLFIQLFASPSLTNLPLQATAYCT
jgi:hypothetical protein